MQENETLDNSWYTKYRPRTLEEYCGDRIKDLVKKRFSNRKNIPHVMLIHGTRGCGKTTLARLLSKWILCEHPNEDGSPCEECEMCKAITDILIAGNSTEMECPGVTELDATIMNGKEAIQQVLDDAIQMPIYSKYKVLIVDECHMISNAGQNSMLKIIEDIPEHLIVIFATTNKEKVLNTILSRCTVKIEARKQTVKDMANRLMEISEKEGLEVSEKALEVIAKKGERVPRECINLLEAIAKTYDNEITIKTVEDYIGGSGTEIYIEYFKAANTSLADTLTVLKKLKEEDIKKRDFVNGLMGLCMDAMYIKNGINLEEYTADYIKVVKELFEIYTENEFDMLLQILENLTLNISDSEGARDEILLTTAAMRISKIDLLARGLAKEREEAVIENKESLFKHSQLIKESRASLQEIVKKTEIDSMEIEDVKETFDDIVSIQGTQDWLKGIDLEKVKNIEDGGGNKGENKEEDKVASIIDSILD